MKKELKKHIEYYTNKLNNIIEDDNDELNFVTKQKITMIKQFINTLQELHDNILLVN